MEEKFSFKRKSRQNGAESNEDVEQKGAATTAPQGAALNFMTPSSSSVSSVSSVSSSCSSGESAVLMNCAKTSINLSQKRTRKANANSQSSLVIVFLLM